jgi:PPOX class probable F420-dependent enzyme
MSNPPLPEAAVTMLAKANPAVITTLRPDGQPVSTATWYLWDNGQVLVNMDEGRKRLEHMRNDPRVTLTVLDEGSWYTHISVIGHVTAVHRGRWRRSAVYGGRMRSMSVGAVAVSARSTGVPAGDTQLRTKLAWSREATCKKSVRAAFMQRIQGHPPQDLSSHLAA